MWYHFLHNQRENVKIGEEGNRVSRPPPSRLCRRRASAFSLSIPPPLSLVRPEKAAQSEKGQENRREEEVHENGEWS